jgi:hypothetical protein
MLPALRYSPLPAWSRRCSRAGAVALASQQKPRWIGMRPQIARPIGNEIPTHRKISPACTHHPSMQYLRRRNTHLLMYRHPVASLESSAPRRRFCSTQLMSHRLTAISTEPPDTRLIPSKADEHAEIAGTRGVDHEGCRLDPLENRIGPERP